MLYRPNNSEMADESMMKTNEVMRIYNASLCHRVRFSAKNTRQNGWNYSVYLYFFSSLLCLRHLGLLNPSSSSSLDFPSHPQSNISSQKNRKRIQNQKINTLNINFCIPSRHHMLICKTSNKLYTKQQKNQNKCQKPEVYLEEGFAN